MNAPAVFMQYHKESAILHQTFSHCCDCIHMRVAEYECAFLKAY